MCTVWSHLSTHAACDVLIVIAVQLRVHDYVKHKQQSLYQQSPSHGGYSHSHENKFDKVNS